MLVADGLEEALLTPLASVLRTVAELPEHVPGVARAERAGLRRCRRCVHGQPVQQLLKNLVLRTHDSQLRKLQTPVQELVCDPPPTVGR